MATIRPRTSPFLVYSPSSHVGIVCGVRPRRSCRRRHIGEVRQEFVECCNAVVDRFDLALRERNPRASREIIRSDPMAKPKERRSQPSEERPAFDAEAFLESAGAARRVATYPKGKTVFSQGQPSDAVMYIQKGSIKISVLSRTGKEAVLAMLGPGDFFGEGALTGQSVRIGTATATALTTVLIVEKDVMLRLLREEPTFSERFISYMLARNIRIEADLVDHLFNSSEKRLARALLLLARYGDQAGPERRIPKISQETLAEMIGTTRSRVNFFMNKFRDLGFIEYNGDIKVNTSLLGVVLHD
jgi:CRP/FNR family cyclic AMP-dependent transcriptional regulator